MASVYSHIDQNKNITYLIIAIFVSLITFVGWFFGEYYYGGGGLMFVGIALIFSGLSSFFAYYNSDKLVLAISKAKKLEYGDNPQLHKLVENMCIASGLQTKPKIYIIDDSAPNAFATGRDPNHAAIVFTSGILQKLEKRELEGVIAHELSHVLNYDILLMSIVSVLVGTITLIADWFTRGVFYSRGKRSNSQASGVLVIIGLVAILLSPIIASLIKLAVSRKREFLADASAVMLTRYPKGLANALTKIAADREILEVANGATAHLYISNPLKGQKNNLLANLFNTHPSVQERISRILSM